MRADEGEQLRLLLGLLDEAVDSAGLVGVYRHGSAVGGGLRPASDVDVLVVTRRSLDDGPRRALTDGLLALSGRAPFRAARPLEVTVVVWGEVRPWRYPPVGDYLYGEWLRTRYEAGDVPRPAPMPDLALVLTEARAADRPLSGPPVTRVLDPVPHADVVRACVAGLPGLLAEVEEDTRNVVLTLARIWSTLATGEIRAKDAAADWALPRLPPSHRPVLRHARALYVGSRYDEEEWGVELRAGVPAFVAAVRAEIRRLTPG